MTKKGIIIGAVVGGVLAIGGLVINKLTESKEVETCSESDYMIEEIEVEDQDIEEE